MTATQTLKHPRKRSSVIKTFLKVADGKHDSESYSTANLNCNSFITWRDQLAVVEHADAARNLLYYGFQPLYDALVNGNVKTEEKKNAQKALALIIQRGTEYLGTYYLKNPDISILHALAEEIKDLLPTCNYTTKRRNVDTNGIYPKDIFTFIKKLNKAISKKSFETPVMLVACACGPSEIAMAASAILEIPVRFLRYSWRRGDSKVKALLSDRRAIAKAIEGKTVLCLEDYVCSGNSLSQVMKSVKKYKPSKLIGVSVNTSHELEKLQKVSKSHKFNVYALKEKDEN